MTEDAIPVTEKMLKKAFRRLYREQSIEVTTYWMGWNHPVGDEAAANHMFKMLAEEAERK